MSHIASQYLNLDLSKIRANVIIIFFFPFFIIWKTKGQRQRKLPCAGSTPAGAGTGPNPRAGNTVLVSHMSNRDPINLSHDLLPLGVCPGRNLESGIGARN